MHTVSNEKIAVARNLSLIALAAWFLAALLGGLTGFVNTPGRPPLTLLYFLVVPMGGFLIAYWRSASFRAFAASISLTLLVGSHLWRFVGLGFVAGWMAGYLPAGFGIPEGLGDALAALGALLLLPSIRKGHVSRGWLLAWNVFGFVDLLSAITVGIFYSESTLGVLRSGGVSTRLMVTFPVSLIPTFFVPLFILLHLLTFKRIADLPMPPQHPGRSRPAAERSRIKRHPVDLSPTIPNEFRRLPHSPFRASFRDGT